MANLFSYTSNKLASKFENDEANLLAKYLLEDLGFSDEHSLDSIDPYIERLLKDEPLQYVTGKAYFLDYVLHVNNSVLIPRPETEELVVQSIALIEEYNVKSILEVGVGSGCIAVGIKDKFRNTEYNALDISENALLIAAKNAEKYELDIAFHKLDFLDEDSWKNFPQVDMLVSNPPYITSFEKNDMLPNVLEYEPHIALFALGEDPLIFYKKIAKFASQNHAMVACEINEYKSDEIALCFSNYGFNNVEILKDLQGKNRMVIARY